MIPAIVPACWAHLAFFARDWPGIQARLDAEPRPVYPPRERMFAALSLAPADTVRVVILGQDPYHTAGKADGLAFSITDGFRGNLASLGNIFKELQSDLGILHAHTSLEGWARQGVLLLNTALSVPDGQPKAHARIGWDRLVAEIVAELDARPRAFLLWGRPAQTAARPHLTNSGHLVIESAHPSPLSARHGFLGSRPFSRVNGWLAGRGEKPVDWAL